MRAPDASRHVDFSKRWPEVEQLLAKLGVDANAVAIDIGPHWQKLGYPQPQQTLREELEELNASYLNRRQELTSLQAATVLRGTLTKAEELLGEFADGETVPLLCVAYRRKEATAAREAVAAYADTLRWTIAEMEKGGSGSRRNASKRMRNNYWLDVDEIWQAATVNATKKPGRKNRFTFITIVAPTTAFAPGSEREVNAVIDSGS